MPVTITIHLGENTFDVGGDLPDLVPVVDLFRIWVNAQQTQDGDPQKLAELTAQLKGSQDQLAHDVQASTPTP